MSHECAKPNATSHPQYHIISLWVKSSPGIRMIGFTRHISHQETIKPRCPKGLSRQTLARGQSLLGLCQRGAGGWVWCPSRGDMRKSLVKKPLGLGTWWRCARKKKSRLVWLGASPMKVQFQFWIPDIFIWPEGASIPTYGCVFIHG